MSEKELLDAISAVKKEVGDVLKQRSAWERALAVIQIVIVVVGGGWALFTYYVNWRAKALMPANIIVSPSIENIGVLRGLRILRIRITVENKGARAYVINSPFNVWARRVKGTSAGHFVSKSEWDGSSAAEERQIVLRSGEAFGRGFWFEPGEQSVRSYIVAVPENEYDVVEISAKVRHCRFLTYELDTDPKFRPDHSFTPTTIVRQRNATEPYDSKKHQDIKRRSVMAMNEGAAEALLRDTSASIK